MNKLITVNNEEFKVKDDEFNKVPHDEFNNLIILDSLGYLERIISLLKEMASHLFHHVPNLLMYNSTHGGYVPIKCSKEFKNIFIYNKDEKHVSNILANVYKYDIQNISIIDKTLIDDKNIYLQDIVFINDFCDSIENLNLDKSIVLCNKQFSDSVYVKDIWYSLYDTDLMIYIPKTLQKGFVKEFHYFMEDDNILKYDNLIHYTMIVKNGGDSLEKILTNNMSLIDRWTILDTGSTDNTINIIERVLYGKKKGKLYQEPFIDFKASRNRCLDLAGNNCKFTMMLDDTYMIEGDLRKFLTEVRGDQFSDSLSLFIKSDDVCYSSNRIIKSETGLRYIYRIHEVITPKNNKNVMVPIKHAAIFDFRSDYMEERTMNRKLYDIELLFKELEDDPNDPRALYYLGQTYNLLKYYELAFEYYIKRVEHPVEGFFQERIDACFEAARMANFRLNKPWEECEKLYLRSFEMDKTRADALYFVGIHYYLEAQAGKDVNKNNLIAYTYMKQCLELGYPEHCQYSLKPTLHFYFLPKFLSYLSFLHGDYKIGIKACEVFLEKVKEDNSVPVFKECFNQGEYKTVKSWYGIHQYMTLVPEKLEKPIVKGGEKPIFIFMADGGFSNWTGKDILTKGMGGSETFTIEISRYLQKSGHFKVIVFCRCDQTEVFEGVEYRNLNEYFPFIFSNNVHTCIIGRYSEYVPASFRGFIDNIYMIAHDLDFTGNIIMRNNRLRNIICLSQWHADYLTSIYPTFNDIIVPFGYGIDNERFKNLEKEPLELESYPRFIYSSFPIRGLLPLLEMWPKILERYPSASLVVHCDIEGWWSNSMRPLEMQRIKDILNLYKEDGSIIYKGWTSKGELAQSWINADVCFYPCTYYETFCHTILEAAISKTLVITTELAALTNTVADRGVLLKGDFYDPKFQKEALVEVFKTLENKKLWNELVDKNYNWALNMNWESRAERLLQDYLLPTLENPVKVHKNVDPLLNYGDMYNWTNDLPNDSITQFNDIIDYIKWKNEGKEINILEIGTYTGISVIKFLELLPNSKAIVIDRWEDYFEKDYLELGKYNFGKVECLTKIKSNNIEQLFYDNIKTMNFEDKIQVFKGDSFDTLLKLVKSGKHYFDFIYVDGSHNLLVSYTDILLSFDLLKQGGIIGIDDYLYNKNQLLESPFEAVNTFIEKRKKEIKVLSKDYRVFIEKL